MIRPKVSVIVPIYNADRYLRQCLTTLQVQTLEDIEVIMCDNLSTDQSRDIMNEYALKDRRFKCIYHDKNMGQAQNMIDGLTAATGEYIAECDSDDFVAPSMYERLYNYAKLHDLDVVQCGFVDYTDDHMRDRKICIRPVHFDPAYVGGTMKMDLIGNQAHIMSAIYRRQWILDNDLWYQPTGRYQDTSLSFKLRTSTDAYGMIPDFLYYYRRDNDQSGSATEKEWQPLIDQMHIIDKYNEDHGLHLDIFIGVLRFYTYRWMWNRLSGHAKEEFMKAAVEDMQSDIVMSSLFCNREDYQEYKQLVEPPM